MKKSSAVLLDEALTLYLAELAVEPQDPRRVLDDVRVLAAGAQDGADVAWAMRGLMAALGDDRSTMTPAGAPAPVPARVETRPPEVERRPDGIAVLRLGAVDFRSDAERLAWAQALHDRIAALAATHRASVDRRRARARRRRHLGVARPGCRRCSMDRWSARS